MPKNFSQIFFQCFFWHRESEYRIHFFPESFHFFNVIFAYFLEMENTLNA